MGNPRREKGGVILQTFSQYPRIFFGSGALDQLTQCRAQSVLVVTDRFFSENGTAQAVGARVPGAEVTVFGGVTPDPPVAVVAAGAAVLARCRPQALIALGGGSVLDCAKAMLYLQDLRPLFVAVPTTSGSGSEVTGFSILTHGGVKHPLVDDALRPDWAILDASLLTTLPPGLIAETGMDAVCHSLEAAAARGASPLSDALAYHAFVLCLAHLPASYRGDTAVRGEVHLAAAMAGMAFDHAGLGLCHALAHALGGRFHTAHGRLGGVLLPGVLAYNGEACAPRYAALARSAGLGAATDRLSLRNLIAAVCRLRDALGLPATLSQAGIAREELTAALDGLVQAALSDPCAASNPREAGAEDLKTILRRCMI
ncbi:MAG: iron-containing alcohol dehydrogenase [Oscillospiraceae bacterium]|nr:iron-containing alcohol dehydrogenase [Oscillospiraceae bacterium]